MHTTHAASSWMLPMSWNTQAMHVSIEFWSILSHFLRVGASSQSRGSFGTLLKL